MRCHVYVGPESGVKNQKNERPSRDVILYHLDVGKQNQTLIKAIYQKVPSQK
jgi:hypothetical protein